MPIAPALLSWWDAAGRKDLPWQNDPTPYRVWVSEIMLQQTQVTTVERYYDRFLTAFPDVVALAAAELDRVLHLWSGLGYYARARNLHRAATRVRDEFSGRVPETLDELIALPGIGRSTAGAILALSRDQRHPILDGNAKRVLARYFGVDGWTGSARNLKVLWQHADDCTPHERPAHYTQAIMDLGATVCTRSRPSCSSCPLANACRAHREGLTGQIPAPRPKRAKPQRHATLVVLVRDDGAVLLERRPDSGVWGGLWCFPETADVEGVEEWCRTRVGMSPVRIDVRPVVSHSFTHFDLDMTPVEARVDAAPLRLMDGDQWLWYNRNEPAAVGLAAPVARMLEAFGEER
ncbi:MAG: A/G-specific adenine glycosylase [Gammaproteobacteria bacterium]|nr:A/G-specific adenine glycosylase [Gammaproteobacteria bacterium]MBT8444182.1 A/G-specific adenine glycosylase [Gammaproteobacteria bacterium]NND36926.1 A/G-specific adenine glycosylase [Gammaproteobacteria bacterium]